MLLHKRTNRILIVIGMNFLIITLKASGEAVGLPEGQMGNSEVGHTNIGAGRIVYQNLTRVDIAIREGEIKEIQRLYRGYRKCKKHDSALHLFGFYPMAVYIVILTICLPFLILRRSWIEKSVCPWFT